MARTRVHLPDALDRDIRALLPDIPFQKEHVDARDVLTEESLEELKAFLESNALTKPWSANPRLYALLRISAGVGEEDLTVRPYSGEELLAHGLSDYALPFSEATLPAVIGEKANTARRILNLQNMVKSSPESMSFNDHILKHRNSKVPPFRTTPQLPATQGSFGQVESVINTRSELIFARKIMTRPRNGTTSDTEAQPDRQWRLKHFKNEVEILQRLNHEHLVRFCGSYTDENNFALLVQPVAERTLHDLLIRPYPLSAEDTAMMHKSFGCLAFGLAWLHSRLIRHKDIKPANILISSGSMLFCDFGSAMDAELRDTTRTEGPAHMRTPRYVSPETHEEKERNEASDVWSLGCVFLEMLAVLTGSSVGDLLKYIHDALGRPGLPQNVRYWEGSSSAILQHWIVQTAEVPEVQFMAHWTKQMVERAPEARPLAATLVAAAQSHEGARPGLCHIGNCCATSEVPILPEPRRAQASPLAPPARGTSGWVSFNSPATTRSQQLEGGTSFTNPFPATIIRTQSIHSRTDSAQPNTGHSSGSGGSHGATLIFQAPLTSESFKTIEPRVSSEESLSCTRLLRLYELVATDLYRTTRRLVFLCNEDDGPAERREFWMPFADTAVVRRETRVIISWSDCNQLESLRTVDGVTPYSRVYKRLKPNNALLIHFEDTVDARNFASHISTPRKANPGPRGWSASLSQDATSDAWGFDATGEIKRDTVCTGAVYYTVQGIDCYTAGINIQPRGLLVSADNDLTTSTSRIYWLPSAIDIKLGPDTESKPSVEVTELSVAIYKSDVQAVSKSEKGKAGSFLKVELSPCTVSWRFQSFSDRREFLNGISTWTLRQCTSVNCVSRMSLIGWSKRGRADLLFWSSEDGDVAVTFRLKEANRGKSQWITGRLTTSGASESYSGQSTTIKVMSYSRDELLDLSSMHAVPNGRPEVSPEHHDASKALSIKIEFYSVEDMHDFQEQIRKYRKLHKDGASVMHNSPASSAGTLRPSLSSSLQQS